MPARGMRYPLKNFVMSLGGLSLSLAIAKNDFLWSLMSFIYLVLMLAVLKIPIRSQDKIDLDSLRKLIFFCSIFPLLISLIGLFRGWKGFFLLEETAFVFLLSIFALMIILILENYTSLKSELQFTGIFLYSFPIGAGATRSIGRFLSDKFFHTEHFHGNSHFMLELLIMTILCFHIVYFIKHFLKNSRYNVLLGMNRELEITSPFDINKEDLFEFLNSVFNKYNRSKLITVSTIFQWGIYGVIIYGLIVENHSVTVWAIFSFGISVIPEMLARNTKSGFPAVLYFWFTFVLFVFTVGRPLGFYSLSNWWAEITHFLAGSAVALVLFSILVYFDDRSENLYIPRWLIPLFILLFILPIGVFWEITEFYVDIIFDSRTQAGLEDTAYDILFNFLGALLSITTVSLFSEIELWSPYRSKLFKVLKRLNS